MSDKIYIFQGKEKVFDNGGSKIRLSSPIEELERLISHQKAQGDTWINIDICKRKEPSEKGMTHYGVLDLWKPEGSKSQQPSQQPKVAQAPVDDDFSDDIPF